MDEQLAKKQIGELIADFKSNYQQYKDEQEANTETKLIEPLFHILGWERTDFEKRARTRRESKKGFADYAFKIDGRTVFFLEAKRIGIPLEKEADKQVISYALSKRIPFAVATNFEELKIFCVEQEDAINQVFRVFTKPEDYINKFPNLLLLSKENFQKNLTLKEAENEGRLRKRVSIDKTLLNDFMQIRKLIADDIEKTYPKKYELNEKEEIVQRIIDRLIFIRRCEDVEINPEDVRLEEIRHLPDNRAYTQLKEIFSKYNDVYNSGLFAIGIDNDLDSIKIDGTIIKRLIGYLYESNDKQYIYNFDWINADVLGQVYEQYLGKILEQTKSGRAKLQDGQAHRKEQGIYYTPTYIVDYIVRNTLLEILKNKKIKQQQIKVLDAACGSGSFLIKAFDYLYNNFSLDDETKQQKMDSQGRYSIKTEILKRNVYGVDLDIKAVEITKLNLLLKASEKNRKLPEEIDLHIRHGNSLINDENIVHSAFKWDDEFSEGTFDVIVGNPPYINNRNLEDDAKLFFEKAYSTAYQQYDIYVLFYELALKLLKENGYIGFITPNKFAITKYGVPLRKLLLQNKIIKVVDVSQLNVFGDVSTYPYIVIVQKAKPSNKHEILFYKPTSQNLDITPARILQSSLNPEQPLIFDYSIEDKSIMAKIKGDFVIDIFRAKPTTKNIDNTEKGNVITNKDIDQYGIMPTRKKIAIKKDWQIILPAILMKKLCFTPTAAILNREEYIPVNTTYVVHSKDKEVSLEYILAILNSDLIGYYTRRKYAVTAMRGGYIELRTFEIENIPIKKVSNTVQEKIAEKAKAISSLKNKLLQLGDKITSETKELNDKIIKLNKEINQEIYRIYDITEEERSFIEESLKQ